MAGKGDYPQQYTVRHLIFNLKNIYFRDVAALTSEGIEMFKITVTYFNIKVFCHQLL